MGLQYCESVGQSDIEWEGNSGLEAEDFHSKTQHGFLAGKTPKSIFVHVGGNNVTNTHTCKLI
ncbi:hypothetical protein DPMN_042614 [Dreissena polymorpha]|uniref:Uncharacterized protein n=1 Tax=Dreissena polymorpha TaxID=45954 RepID=A0A9D4D1D0_DREPO|nr:hypothetical protein DPMN_042614 [Dreissena polymorpha]